MSGLVRIFLTMLFGVAGGILGFLMSAIFAPLIFPDTLQNTPHPDKGADLMMIVVLFLAVCGMLVFWKMSARWVEED